MRTCKQCGKNLSPHQLNFCGHKCRGASRTGISSIPELPCKICGTLVRKRPKTEGAGIVCSDACLRESRRRTGKQLAIDGKIPHNPMSEEARKAASKRMTGAGCPKWNGGKTTGGSGKYTLVTAPPDYPFPESVSTRGYIREHRMVMELHLGRPLRKDEEIHHINHDSKDNRIENLQVMTRQEHMAQESADGTFHKRWMPCVYGCGKGTKAALNRHFQACAGCRKEHPEDPRSFMEHEWTPKPLQGSRTRRARERVNALVAARNAS